MERVVRHIVLLVLSLVSASAQTVSFRNSDTYATMADRTVYDAHGRPLAGTNYLAQLYYGLHGATPASLVAVTTAPAQFRDVTHTNALAGSWTGGVRTLTGMSEGAQVTLQVRVWDGRFGSTFDQAAVNPASSNQYGVSCPFSYTIPPPGVQCGPFGCNIENFRAFSLVTNPPPGVIRIRRENENCLQEVFLGRRYVDASADLRSWTSLGTQASPFIDVTNLPARFYRFHDGAKTNMTVPLLLTFESGTIGEPINAAYMNANTIGILPGTWTLEGTAGIVSLTNRALTTPVIVAGTPYTGVGTRGLEFSHRTEGYFQLRWPSGQRTNSVVLAGWFMDTMPADNTDNFDMVSLETAFDGSRAEFATMQLDSFTLLAHTSQGGGRPVPIRRATWYWVVVLSKRGVGCTVWVYNTSGELVGTSFCPFGSNSNGTSIVTIGNSNPHGHFPSGSAFFDSVLILWGIDPPAPVGP